MVHEEKKKKVQNTMLKRINVFFIFLKKKWGEFHCSFSLVSYLMHPHENDLEIPCIVNMKGP